MLLQSQMEKLIFQMQHVKNEISAGYLTTDSMYKDFKQQINVFLDQEEKNVLPRLYHLSQMERM